MNRMALMILAFIPAISFGQKKPIPLNISVFNESTAIPFTRFVTTPVHPGLQLGTEFNYREKPATRFFQSVSICYFYHNYLAQGIGISTELGYEYRLPFGLSFEGLIGVGYMHTFATTEEFTFSNGLYEKKADIGNARLYPSISLDAGYYIKKSEKNSPRVFIRYQSWIEYPYSPDFIPVMTHISLHVGVRVVIAKKTGRYE